MNNQKYILLAFLGAAILVGMSVRGLAVPLLARLEVADPQILGVVDATSLAGLVLGLLTFLVLNRHPAAYSFTDQVMDELRKVVWPDRQETIRSTLVVVGFTVIVAVALGAYDFIWAHVTEMFLYSES